MCRKACEADEFSGGPENHCLGLNKCGLLSYPATFRSSDFPAYIWILRLGPRRMKDAIRRFLYLHI